MVNGNALGTLKRRLENDRLLQARQDHAGGRSAEQLRMQRGKCLRGDLTGGSKRLDVEPAERAHFGARVNGPTHGAVECTLMLGYSAKPFQIQSEFLHI